MSNYPDDFRGTNMDADEALEHEDMILTDKMNREKYLDDLKTWAVRVWDSCPLLDQQADYEEALDAISDEMAAHKEFVRKQKEDGKRLEATIQKYSHLGYPAASVIAFAEGIKND